MTVTKGPHEISVPTLFDPREEDISNHDNGGDATTGNQLDDLSTLHTPAATEDLASKLRNLQGTTCVLRSKPRVGSTRSHGVRPVYALLERRCVAVSVPQSYAGGR